MTDSWSMMASSGSKGWPPGQHGTACWTFWSELGVVFLSAHCTEAQGKVRTCDACRSRVVVVHATGNQGLFRARHYLMALHVRFGAPVGDLSAMMYDV